MTPFPSASPSPYGAIPREAERLIALSRAALAFAACVAIWLDPLLPAVYPPLVSALLGSYLAGAVALAAIMEWRGDSLGAPLLALVIRVGYAIDVLVVGPIVFLDGGLASSLFMVFTFAVATAAYRWHLRGALVTAMATTGALLVADGISVFVLGDQRFATPGTLTVMRVVAQFVLAVLLGHLGAVAAEQRNRLFEISSVRRSEVHDLRALLEESLRAATNAFGAFSAVLVWEDPDEPWLVVAEYAGDVLHVTREPPGLYGGFTSDELYHYDFVAADAAAPTTSLLTASQPDILTDRVACIHPELVRRLGMHQAMCLRVRGDIIDARLLIQSARPLVSDDIVLGRLVAGHIVDTLDLHLMARRLRDAAVIEERERVSRELHDGMLQALAGAALTLRRAAQKLDTDPAETRTLLAAVERLLLDEQRELRGYLQELKTLGDNTSGVAPLPERLRALAQLLLTIWSVRVVVSVAPETEGMSQQDVRELFRLTQEAITNAARHGGASVVEVNVALVNGAFFLSVADNGTGFSFHGRHEMSSLDQRQAGPLKLKERVKALHGTLSIDSSPGGARIEIVFPPTVTGVPHGDSARPR